MKQPSPIVDKILDAAEVMARTGGYNGFSYREIAKQVGIKAASVHYHFPGKPDLGAAMARRYADRFMEALGDPDDPETKPDALLARYVGAYRTAACEDDLMCLCGMLGAEVTSIPEAVATETKLFFEKNIAWLEAVLARLPSARDANERTALAMKIVATLEGAVIMSRTLGDPSAFDRIAGELLADL